jgi:putative transposase
MRYTSDLTDSQWEIIKDEFPVGNKSKYDKRELVNAVLYLVKTGCQWRNLPTDFPKWKAVSMFFYRARKNGTWDRVQKLLVKKTRIAKGKNAAPTYALIDSQSVKTVSASQQRGFDGGKKRKDENGIS